MSDEHHSLKLLVTWLFVQRLVQVKNWENIKTPHYWPIVSESTVMSLWITFRKGQQCGKHYHVMISSCENSRIMWQITSNHRILVVLIFGHLWNLMLIERCSILCIVCVWVEQDNVFVPKVACLQVNTVSPWGHLEFVLAPRGHWAHLPGQFFSSEHGFTLN